jgi:hypothetical protein
MVDYERTVCDFNCGHMECRRIKALEKIADALAESAKHG